MDTLFSRKRTVLLLLFFILTAGLFAYIKIPKESNPDISIPVIYVSMIMDGISPEDAERLLVRPMERELSNIEGVKEMTASAMQGSASVNLEFEAGFDSDKALADVREKVDIVAPELPIDADEPTVHEINFSLFPVLLVTLSGEVPERTLTRIAKNLGEDLESIAHVLEARLIGEREEVVEVIVEPSTLLTYNLSQEDIMGFLSRNNRIVAAGNMDTGAGRFAVKVPGLFKTAQEVMELPVKRDGDKILRLQDVATVRRTFKDRHSYARLNSEPAIVLEVSKRAGENVLDTIAAIKAKVEEAKQEWPSALNVTYSQDQSKNIRDMLTDLQNNVISAVILVMIVVILALGPRSAGLVGIAIPGSFLAGVLFLYAIGLTVNIVVLFSLIMAVGMLVDGAIVVTEFADRKMAEGEDKASAYSQASKRMATPIIASTLTTLAAFAPLLFWPGIVGEFMRYLPITLMATLTASLAMALIFVPTLGSLFGKPNNLDTKNLEALDGHKTVDLTQLSGFTGAYTRTLSKLLPHPILQLSAIIALFAAIMMVYGMFGKGVEFFPKVEPDFAALHIRARGNLSVEEANVLVKQVEDRIIDMDELKFIYVQANPELRGQDIPEDAIGSIQFEFTHWESRRRAKQIYQEIRDRTADLAGIALEIQEPDEGPPVGKPVQIQISSAFPDALNDATERVLEKFKNIDGLIDIADTRPIEGFEWEISVDRAQAARFGADVLQIGNAVQMVTNGIKIGDYRPLDADDEVEIRARYPYDQRNLAQMDQLKIVTPLGLAPIVNFIQQNAVPRLQKIDRTEQRRYFSVGAELDEGFQAVEVVEQLREWLPNSGVDFTRVKLAFKGEDEEQQAAQAFLGKAFVMALFAIAIILVTQFNSFYQSALILTAVLFSTFGVIIGLLIMDQAFGIVMNGIGVIALAGIVVNNNIVLIDTYNHHKQHMTPHEAALLTAAQRLRPVLLTTITTILGLIPMVFAINLDFFTPHISIGAPSTQWWTQLATSVAFGLAFATILTLVLTPSLLAFEGKFRKPKHNVPTS